MDFKIIADIETQLKSVDCKSYTLDIKFDNDTRLFIEKKPEDKPKLAGFGDR
jgi:hypothetical protein